ncbi:integrase [Paenibacillus glucanolyticus]|jgi:integrase/recombinase XerD|uniref:tyrosine-type recombinase/integrase n=1 Tax=Paenibacillus TaxID=44249 RepID=UPI0003E1CF88|nr:MULTISPECIES: tyrosine-type recombinase/integrase [Paenibacillus]ANA80169.1 integrase [Paenibacillus glucanolyticus]AVV55764.1 integrase [Paenibacillus glucanolyticus]ETT38579.1 integrase [Paenibacillus sp. FSL R5-808]
MDKRTGRKTVGTRQPIVNVALPSYTLQEAVDFVIKIKRANNLKGRTISGYIQNMNYFIEWVTERYGEITICEVTADLLREYVLWCAKDKEYYAGHPFKAEYEKGKLGLSPASVNVRIRVLKTFFAVLYGEEVIDRNPAINVSLMRQDVDTVMPLSDDELRRFMKAPDQRQWAQWRDYVIMTLILDTGLRLGEICALEKPEIDFVKKSITLPASKNKNRKSRTLPLSTETARLLKQLIAETERNFNTTYVFTTNYGEQLSEKTIQKSFDNYAERAKLGRTVSPHVLRHNFATMAAENGMSIFHLQKLMGHADIATTRKYVQISEGSLAEEHKRYSPLTRLTSRKGGR